MTAILVALAAALLLAFGLLVLIHLGFEMYAERATQDVLVAHNQALTAALAIEEARHVTEVALYEEAWRQRGGS